MSNAVKYLSQAAAEHAAKVLGGQILHARIEVTRERSLRVWTYPETLSPAQRKLLEPHELIRPTAPDPTTPLLQPRKKRPKALWGSSEVEKPAAVCMTICENYRGAGRIDDRAAILAELIELGVNPNTAKTYYTRFRVSIGLPKSVRAVRRAAAEQSKTKLTDKRPAVGLRTQNGITEPLPSTSKKEVWDMADLMYRRIDRSPTQAEMRLRLSHIPAETIKVYLHQWRKFHALKNERQT